MPTVWARRASFGIAWNEPQRNREHSPTPRICVYVRLHLTYPLENFIIFVSITIGCLVKMF